MMTDKTPAETKKPIKIFINYRRADSRGYAGRLYYDLSNFFGEDKIFMDISDIGSGEDFFDVIENAISSCDVFLVLIGDQWQEIQDNSGNRRINAPEDYVRKEIELAFKNNLHIVPVLVKDATMPDPQALPKSLKNLSRRNALEVTDERWDFDIKRLIMQLEAIADSRKKDPPKILEEAWMHFLLYDQASKNEGRRENRLQQLNVISFIALIFCAILYDNFSYSVPVWFAWLLRISTIGLAITTIIIRLILLDDKKAKYLQLQINAKSFLREIYLSN